jgi:hypothetical protein
MSRFVKTTAIMAVGNAKKKRKGNGAKNCALDLPRPSRTPALAGSHPLGYKNFFSKLRDQVY